MQHDEDETEELSNEEEHADVLTADDSLSSGSSATLLSVLDDKNRAIEILQQQLQNQKLQLGYYIKNALKSSKIMQLSKTCEPDTVDNNISLTLALSNFCKQTGMKSRLMNLYEHMTTTDERIQNVIERQEYLLKEIVDKFIGIMFQEDFNVFNNKICLPQFFYNKQHFDMLNDIFHSTVDLKSEMERYRLCCNRLIAIEDERNALVEQVYSLPAEERTRCNYFMAVEMERNVLMKEMGDIRNEQMQLQKQLQQLKIIEDGLREAQMNGDYPSVNFGTQLIDMLESVKTDAFALLTTSTSQKCRYNNELTQLTMQNRALQQELKNMQQLMSENVKSDLLKDFDRRINGKDKVIAELQLQLVIKTDENESLLHTVDKLRREIHELETTRVNLEDVESLQTERDNYKSQVEDLEAIRRAYSQLVEHHPDIEAELVAKEKQIKELEAYCESMFLETTKLKEMNELHESHITNLLKIIDKFAECKNEEILPKKVDMSAQYSANKCETVLEASKSDCNNQSVSVVKHRDSVVDNANNLALANKISCGIETKDNDNHNTLQSHLPVLAKTTFKVERTDKDGRVHTVKAILESTSSIQGIIHLENAANKMSLDVHCRKPLHVNPSVPDVADENELMKDSSKESLPNTCNPYQSYKSCVVKEIIKNSKDETSCSEIIRTKKSEILDDNENEYFDVIEYKTPPHSQEGSGTCWRDSSSSSFEVSSSANYEDLKIAALLLENTEEKEKGEQVEKQEQAFNQLVSMNKSLKLITSKIDTILKLPGGKASVISTLQEMYRSLFSKNNV